MYFIGGIFLAFFRNQKGATSIEYGLIAALISVGVVSGATSLGNNIEAKFTTVAQNLSQAGSRPPASRAPAASPPAPSP